MVEGDEVGEEIWMQGLQLVVEEGRCDLRARPQGEQGKENEDGEGADLGYVCHDYNLHFVRRVVKIRGHIIMVSRVRELPTRTSAVAEEVVMYIIA